MSLMTLVASTVRTGGGCGPPSAVALLGASGEKACLSTFLHRLAVARNTLA